jgi:hypothetical protein
MFNINNRVKPRLTSYQIKQTKLPLYYKADSINNGSWTKQQAQFEVEMFQNEKTADDYTDEVCAEASSRVKFESLNEIDNKKRSSINWWQKISGLGTNYFVTDINQLEANFTPQASQIINVMADHYGQASQPNQSTAEDIRNNFVGLSRDKQINALNEHQDMLKDNVINLIKSDELTKMNRRWIAQGTVTVAAVAAAAGTGAYLWTKSQK